MNNRKSSWIGVCALSLVLSGCHKTPPSLTGVFAGTIEIDRSFSETIPFGHQINLPIAIRNRRHEPVTLHNFRMPTKWKTAHKGNGWSGGSAATFSIDPDSSCLAFCRFYAGPATDNVDAMRFTKVDFRSPIGQEAMNFVHEDGDIDLTVELRFSIDGEDSGDIPLARYHIDQKKRRAVPVWVARDLQKPLDTEDLKLCDIWGQRKSSH